jgi:hypothetical protein
MKGVSTISLCLLIFTQSFFISVQEAYKLGDFIRHAQVHAEEYGDGFISFLSKHYGNQKKTHQKEHNEHKNLPFNHHSSSNTLPLFTISGKDNSQEHNLFKENVIRPSKPSQLFSLYEKSRIFQPPIVQG